VSGRCECVVGKVGSGKSNEMMETKFRGSSCTGEREVERV
jgi:hypothetical protein